VQENIGVTRLIKRAPAGQGMTAYRRKIIFQPEGVVFHGIFQVLLEHCNGFFPVPIALERVAPLGGTTNIDHPIRHSPTLRAPALNSFWHGISKMLPVTRPCQLAHKNQGP
jgi:hypothetical protein